MDALRKHQQNMKSMINDVSQQLGPRKGIEAVKGREELMKVADTQMKEEEEIDEMTGASSAGAFAAPSPHSTPTGAPTRARRGPRTARGRPVLPPGAPQLWSCRRRNALGEKALGWVEVHGWGGCLRSKCGSNR